ncbi:hypothetical protein TrCOL_g11903 [Triparma columacea]|uniref:Uncharacterized protein n=1 Tax=Triparma columacea TaxID=722753 RepID=A0A9W7GAB5_9STRA|nr:hypothetical protein TrCOL_g11903 [Triparma columacea]
MFAVGLIAALLLFAAGEASGEDFCGPSTAKVIKGQRTYLCLVLADLENWNGSADSGDVHYRRFSFRPVVDDFAKIEVKDSWIKQGGDTNCQNCGVTPYPEACKSCEDNLLRNFTNPSVHVESINKVSYIRKYRGSDNGVPRTFPYMTAIITVDMGTITGITWDEGCTFCLESECVENTYEFTGALKEGGGKACYLDDTTCINGDEVSEVCPLQVYAVWTGTDADGSYLKSAEVRFSQFKSYSMTSWADSLKNKYEEVKSYSEYDDEDSNGV